jgi:hypothetical protein
VEAVLNTSLLLAAAGAAGILLLAVVLGAIAPVFLEKVLEVDLPQNHLLFLPRKATQLLWVMVGQVLPVTPWLE